MITPNTQAGRLLAHLKSGKTLTRLQSFTKLGIVELSARIIDLENNGHVINREPIKVTNRFKESVRVMRYSMDCA